MAKFDTQLSRMGYLMNYESPLKENKQHSPIEYHTTGADGKIYGIIKEGSKYYIKTTQKGKENILESYDYINGYRYRNENGYNSYNEATKQLELKMMSLNESRGIHKDVSTADFKRNEKGLRELTTEARKEINRVNQIIENCDTIGMCNTGDTESSGKSTGANTTKNNAPYSSKVNATLDKDLKATAKDAKSQGYSLFKGDISKDLQSDKMKKGNRGDEEYKDVDCCDSIACQKPKGGKAVKMNESAEYELIMKSGNKGRMLNEHKLESIANRVAKNILSEEATCLDAWGKHPRYGKQPMTMPANTEKFVGTADRDWNDDSAKGSNAYGRKIGSSAPFTQNVDILTDAVVQMVKETLLKKK